MLTRLFAFAGGLSPHSSKIRLSVEISSPRLARRQASRDRHLGAPIAAHPSVADQTSRGPRMRKRIRPARPNARSPPLPRQRAVSGKAKTLPAGFLGHGNFRAVV